MGNIVIGFRQDRKHSRLKERAVTEMVSMETVTEQTQQMDLKWEKVWERNYSDIDKV